MASADEAPTGDDGFTMEFELGVFINISQDVEDVARQGALGNFLKARRMYEEALKAHSNEFPVYAEYLRLCLDCEDWESLALPLEDTTAAHCPTASCGWSDLDTDIANLLCTMGSFTKNNSEGKQTPRDFALVRNSAQRLATHLESKSSLDFDNEQMFAAVVLLLMQYNWTTNSSFTTHTFSLSVPELCALVEHSLRQSHYWVAENLLQVYLYRTYDKYGVFHHEHHGLDEGWAAIQWFVESFITGHQEEEQELWVRIAILQTFSEGVLVRWRRFKWLDGALASIVMPTLQRLVDLARLRDESGEWSHSRASIRQHLISMDTGTHDDPDTVFTASNKSLKDTLLSLHKSAADNGDLKMMYLIDRKMVKDLRSEPSEIRLQDQVEIAKATDPGSDRGASGGQNIDISIKTIAAPLGQGEGHELRTPEEAHTREVQRTTIPAPIEIVRFGGTVGTHHDGRILTQHPKSQIHHEDDSHIFRGDRNPSRTVQLDGPDHVSRASQDDGGLQGTTANSPNNFAGLNRTGQRRPPVTPDNNSQLMTQQRPDSYLPDIRKESSDSSVGGNERSQVQRTSARVGHGIKQIFGNISSSGSGSVNRVGNHGGYLHAPLKTKTGDIAIADGAKQTVGNVQRVKQQLPNSHLPEIHKEPSDSVVGENERPRAHGTVGRAMHYVDQTFGNITSLGSPNRCGNHTREPHEMWTREMREHGDSQGADVGENDMGNSRPSDGY